MSLGAVGYAHSANRTAPGWSDDGTGACGHTFQVRPPDGSGPRRTVNGLAGRTVEVEFGADLLSRWLAHRHNAYQGEAGLWR